VIAPWLLGVRVGGFHMLIPAAMVCSPARVSFSPLWLGVLALMQLRSPYAVSIHLGGAQPFFSRGGVC
jgi:hypothetical protein